MTYEYECEACHHQWEQEQKITEPACKHCPQCKRPAAKRLVSGGTGFTLQGDHWAKKGGY